jgi:peptidoglycan hydrolase CwlO-like protein
MKFDIKNTIILILLIVSILFGYKWFIESDSGSKERVKQLEKEFTELENKKKLTDLEINKWKSKFDTLQKEGDILKQENIKLEAETKKAEQEASKSKSNLDKIRLEMIETKNKIEKLKNNPIKRTGDDLLQSIKNKTK